jgi:hypothetical protein
MAFAVMQSRKLGVKQMALVIGNLEVGDMVEAWTSRNGWRTAQIVEIHGNGYYTVDFAGSFEPRTKLHACNLDNRHYPKKPV